MCTRAVRKLFFALILFNSNDQHDLSFQLNKNELLQGLIQRFLVLNKK